MPNKTRNFKYFNKGCCKYKGKGYLHSLILRVKGKHQIDGPYAYYGVAGDLFLQALLRDFPLDNLGLFVHGDSFFTSPHS